MTIPPPAKRLVEVAREGGECLIDTSGWLHRRVDKVSFVSPGMVCRDISVDFSIPRGYPVFREGEDRNTYFVPVHLLRKWPPLVRLDIRDPHGCPIPLLTSPKNRALDSALLVALAPPGDLREGVAPRLEAVAREAPNRATWELNAVAVAVQREMPRLPSEERQRWLQLLLLASSLVGNSVLWARIDAYPRERQIVKIRFEYPYETRFSLFRRLWIGLSLAPQRTHIHLPNIGEGGSYHLQFDPPPGTTVHRAKLRLRNPLQPAPPERTPTLGDRVHWTAIYLWRLWNTVRSKAVSGLRPDSPPGVDHRPGDTWRLQESEAGRPFEMHTPHRAHLYVRGPRSHYGAVEVDLSADKSSLFSSAVAMAVLIAILLTFFAAAARSIVENLAPAVTTLLFAPALLGYLVTRPVGEHAIRRSQVAGVRLALLATGSLPVFAAIALVSAGHRPRVSAVQGWWVAAAVAAWLLAALLAWSWLLPTIKDPPHGKQPPKWARAPAMRRGPAQ
ncbi:MAG TPA: hypothetical protein VF549_14345 [Solirubrobacteraceae bacterium]|jgi:hypothetical protein